MAELAGLGGLSAVFHIVDGLSGTVAALRDLKDAPSQVEDFGAQSESFCNNLLMFYEVADQHIPLLNNTTEKRMDHAIGLIKQSQSVRKGLEELLRRLKGLYKGAIGPFKSLRVLWDRILWVLKQNQAERWKTNMTLTTVMLSCFMNMLVLEAKEAIVVDDPVAMERKKEQVLSLRAQLKRQIPVIESHRRRLQELDVIEPPQTQEEQRYIRSIMKGVKKFQRSLDRDLTKSVRHSEPAQFVLANLTTRRKNDIQQTRSTPHDVVFSSRGSTSSRPSESSPRSCQRETRLPHGDDPSPVERCATSIELAIHSPSELAISGAHQPMRIAPPESSVPRTAPSFQAPRIRDRGFGPEESYGRWPDSIVQGREGEEESEDQTENTSAHDVEFKVGPDRRKGQSPADSIIDQGIGNSSATLYRANTNHSNPLESSSKNRGGRGASGMAGTSKNPSSPVRSRKIRENNTNKRHSDTSRASAYRNQKRSISPFRPDDRTRTAEPSRRSNMNQLKKRSVSVSITAGHQDRSLTEDARKATVDVRSKLRNTPPDYTTRKELRRVAEKRRRDTEGFLTGNPIEDDEFERRKRRNRWI